MQNKKEILGLIPARGGSTGLPGKNIRLLNGIPLIARTIIEAFKSEYITRVVVVTDSDEIAEVARNYGAETPFKRPGEISGPTSHAFETYKYSVEWLEKNEGYNPEIVCAMLSTTPFRSSKVIDECLKTMIETDCDWCFTVNEIEHHPYRAMIIENNKLVPVFDIPRNLLWANRQELPKMYRFNGGVLAGKTIHIKNNEEYNIDKSDFKNTDVRYVVMPIEDAMDIDSLEDFEFVEYLMKKRGTK
jgi:CMP-N,N'-diacetyllegionaminic acid synthase